MGPHTQPDAIVVGSGFGAAFAAWPLVHAGWRVLMLERGQWLRRGPHNWAPEGVKELSPEYDLSSPVRMRGDHRYELGGTFCVGGQSIFFGGVALRFREADFLPTPEERAAGAAWPFGYDELEPWYSAAERILGVAGRAGEDPTEPWRSGPYQHDLPPLSVTSARIAEAAAHRGFTPFPLPLAINYGAAAGRSPCVGCTSCDCYACAISAKNDMAAGVLPELLRRGLVLQPGTCAVRLQHHGRRVIGVECVETASGRHQLYHAGVVVLAAGALATPHLLLASGAQLWHPAGKLVGRMLTRHCSAVTFGVFPRPLDPARAFHKQVGINDLYFGHPGVRRPAGRLGTIQQIHAPPPGLVLPALPRALRRLGTRVLEHMTGLIVIAADDPQASNRVSLGAGSDARGLPDLLVHHRYTARDRAARAALVRAARGVLREAGALVTISREVRTLSHALGTVRMGRDAVRAPVDETGRYRGTDNLYISDASVLPTGAGVNPSLTIAAVALRIGARLAGASASAMPRLATRAEPFTRLRREATRA